MKRSGPIRRHKRLPRSDLRQLQRKTPMPRSKKRPVPRQRTGSEELAYDDLLTLVYERAGARCERCGTSLLGGFDPHHRKLRSQGGKDDPATVVAICRADHDWIHQNPDTARAQGWLVRRGSDPAAVALVLHDGRTVRLDDDGGYDVVWEAA